MDEDTEPSIIIPDSRDNRLGYLNNANTHFPFVLENKRWATVEHFMLAKQFEGTTLEEEIRKAKNVYKARILAKPKRIICEEDGRVLKKIVYGRRGGDGETTVSSPQCVMREDWEKVKLSYLTKAVKAKFLQNKKALARLLKTEGMRIVDPRKGCDGGAPTVEASVLEKVRDEILEERNIASRGAACQPPKKFAAPYADTKTSTLSEDEVSIVKSFLKGVDILREIENIPSCATLEMFEDVFYNFLGRLDEELLRVIKNWIKENSAKWTDVARNMPNYEAVMREIENILRKRETSVESENAFFSASASLRVKISIFIATIIRWLRMDATSKEVDEFFKKAKSIKKENFVLPPLRRSYRVNIVLPSAENIKAPKNDVDATSPKNIASEAEEHATRGARYIELFRKTHNLDSASFSTTVSYLEKMRRRERKGWLKNFEKLDVLQQKEELRNILGKVKQAKEDV